MQSRVLSPVWFYLFVWRDAPLFSCTVDNLKFLIFDSLACQLEKLKKKEKELSEEKKTYGIQNFYI